MTINYYDDINVYFHMRNHYKKLKNVKSTLDISAPKGFARSCSNSSHSERSFKMCTNEHRHSKTCPHIPNRSNAIKKHSCLESPKAKSDVSLRSVSLPPRPITRRHPYEMPRKIQGKSRSQTTVALLDQTNSTARSSETLQPKPGRKNGKNDRVCMDSPVPNMMSPSSTASSSKSAKKRPCGDENNSRVITKEDEKTENGLAELSENDENMKRNSSRGTARSKSSSSRVEEHEYLQFLLRITEDIIVNNYFQNTDIERVFTNHIEINKGRLDMEKMKEHIAQLASELGIPYESQEMSKEKPRNINLAVKPLPIESIDPSQNCTECASIRAPSNFRMSEEADDYGKDAYKLTYSEEILINRRSLGRVTECTEPSNSIETILNASSKFASRATLSTLGNDTFSSFGNVEGSFLDNTEKPTENLNLVRRVSADENFGIKKYNDIPLTEKERKVSTEEEILFDKLKDCHSNNDILGETMEKKEIEHQFDPAEETALQKTENSTSTFIFNNIAEELNLKFTENKFIQTTDSLILTKDANTQAEPSPVEMVIDRLKGTYDKCTQISVVQCDRECGTSEIAFKDPDIDEEYIRIHSPVYVLKRALGKKEKFLVHKCSDSIEQPATPKCEPPINEKNEEKSVNESSIHETDKSFGLSDYEADAEINLQDPFQMRQTDYTKLLSSDYDLTPERDSSASDKYHHLLVDASTSFSNIGSGSATKNLLLTDKYALLNRREATEESYPHNLDCYYLSHSESSQDNKYEIRNYSIPPDINKAVKSFSYCLNSPADGRPVSKESSIKSGATLADYEIGRRSSVDVRDEVGSSSSPTLSVRSNKDFSVGEIVSRRPRHL